MGDALALLAALAFAIGTVLQQKGTLTTSDTAERSWLLQILSQPVWLAGMLLQSSGWILQAIALAHAPLMVVQSLTTLSIVIALPLGAWITRQSITRVVVVGSMAMVAGVVLFLAAGDPQGGTGQPSARIWWVAGLSTVTIILVLTGLGRRRDGAPRALLFGLGAGFGYALQTAVTKDFVTIVGGGFIEVVLDWSTYALVASAVVGFVLQQSALRTGVLAPAMASSNTATLFGGVLLGRVVYGEMLSRGGGRLLPAVLGLAVAIGGVVLLAGAAGPRSVTPGAPAHEVGRRDDTDP